MRPFVTIPLLLLIFTSATHATAPDRAAQLSQWLGQLADPDPAVRSAAQQALMGIDPAELSLLRQVVIRNSPIRLIQLDPLRQIVEHLYLRDLVLKIPKQPTSFLGINLPRFGVPDLDGRDAGVQVVSRLPGFVASRLLQDGDILLAIGTHRQMQDTLTPKQLQLILQAFKPDDLVTVRLIRGRHTLTVQFKLDAAPQHDLDLPENLLRDLKEKQAEAHAYFNDHFANLPGMPKDTALPDPTTPQD